MLSGKYLPDLRMETAGSSETASIYQNVSEDSNLYVGFEVYTSVVMKSIIFWDMTPGNPLSFNSRFGGTYLLHLQGQRNRFSKPASKQMAEDGKRYVPPKRRLKLNGLHGVISQKMILSSNLYSHRPENFKSHTVLHKLLYTV
jgi:hypothetical protein